MLPCSTHTLHSYPTFAKPNAGVYKIVKFSMAGTKLRFLVAAVLYAAAVNCSATPNFGDRVERTGVQVHVSSVNDDEVTLVKIRNRLPVEDVDTVAISCTGEFEGKTVGDLAVEEVSPYATVFSPDMYGEADLWHCQFEWLGHNLVIGETDVWKSEDNSVTWKIDASGLEYFDENRNSYSFVAGWEQAVGIGASA
ncbi:hypothetical protein Mapa_008487 [Marchantia paleacea]|nr:hypothetical protein Mapa_008487 [Marchantia paleacea]